MTFCASWVSILHRIFHRRVHDSCATFQTFFRNPSTCVIFTLGRAVFRGKTLKKWNLFSRQPYTLQWSSKTQLDCSRSSLVWESFKLFRTSSWDFLWLNSKDLHRWEKFYGYFSKNDYYLVSTPLWLQLTGRRWKQISKSNLAVSKICKSVSTMNFIFTSPSYFWSTVRDRGDPETFHAVSVSGTL